MDQVYREGNNGRKASPHHSLLPRRSCRTSSILAREVFPESLRMATIIATKLSHCLGEITAAPSFSNEANAPTTCLEP